MRGVRERLILERRVEVDALRRCVAVAARGAGSVAIVQGEAGIGKTTLLDVLAREASESSFAVRSAVAHELESELGFGVVRELLAGVLSDRPEERSFQLRGSARAAERVLEPGVDDHPLDPAIAAHALYWLLRNVADARPLALLVDDAHWADEPSLRALAYIARRIDDIRVLLVVARRTGESRPSSSLLDHIADTPRATLVEPAALSEAAVAELVRDELSADPAPAFAAACRRVGGGNPFLTRELLIGLRRDGAQPREEEVAAVERIRPLGVQRWMARRLAQLPPAARALVDAVAVFPAGASLQQARALAGLGSDDAAEAADVLTEARILRRQRPLEFVHPLLRTAVYDAIPPARRAAAHALAARVLEAAAADPQRIAAHVLRADPEADATWVGVLLEAASRAMAGAAPEAAIAFCRRALAEPPQNGEQRWRVLHELGRATTAVAWQEAPDILADAVAAAPDAVARSRSLLLWTHAWGVTGGDPTELRLEVDRALEELDTADPALAGRLRVKRRHLLADEELDAELANDVRTADDGTLEGRTTLVQWAWRQTVAARCAAGDAAALVRRALAAGPVVDWDDPTTAHQYALAIDVLRLSGAIDEAEEMVRGGIRMGADAGDDYVAAMGMAMAADYALERGRLADAEAEATVGRAVAERRGPRMLAVYQCSGVLAAVALERGDVEAAARAVTCVEDPAAPPQLARMAATAHAAVLLARGDARAAVQRALAHGRGPWAATVANPALDAWRSVAADGLAAIGEEEEAARLVADQLAAATRWGTPTGLGEAHRLAGRHAAGASSLDHLAKACELLRPTHARLLFARALVDLGASLRRGHRRSDARNPLREGLAVADECGARALAERAEEELKAAGGRPRRRAQRGRDALTPSELRVCRLAASGLTNREIAQTLFVTLRTVEGHLTASYAKLGIDGRPHLAEALEG